MIETIVFGLSAIVFTGLLICGILCVVGAIASMFLPGDDR